jgi:Subtilase family
VADHDDTMTEGIRYAVDHDAKVISISMAGSGRCPEEMQAAVGYAIEHDVLVVAAGGNWATRSTPPTIPPTEPFRATT